MSKIIASLFIASSFAIGIFSLELLSSEAKNNFSEKMDFFERKKSPGRIEAEKFGPHWPSQNSPENLGDELRQLFPQLNDSQINLIQVVLKDGLPKLRHKLRRSAKTDEERTKIGRDVLAEEWKEVFPEYPSLLIQQLVQIWDYQVKPENPDWPQYILAGLYNYFYLKDSFPNIDPEQLVIMAYRWSNNYGSIWKEDYAGSLPLMEIAEIAYQARSTNIHIQRWNWKGNKQLGQFGHIRSANFIARNQSEYELKKAKIANLPSAIKIAGLIYFQATGAKQNEYCVLPVFGQAPAHSRQEIRLYTEPSIIQSNVDADSIEDTKDLLYEQLNRDVRWRETSLDIDELKRRVVISYDAESIEKCAHRPTSRQAKVITSRGEDPIGEILFASIQDEQTGVSAKISTLFSRFKRGLGVECEKSEEITNFFAKVPEIPYELASARRWKASFFHSGWQVSQGVILAPKPADQIVDQFNSDLIFIYPSGQTFYFDVKI